jgi:hypothetical protein
MSDYIPTIPWSSRAPQKYILSIVAVVICVALISAAVAYISSGTGGIVPFLMIALAPVLTVVYVYSFLFKKWDVPTE